ncbi:MAG: PilZ domain-containing protein [Spirochaetia bacterium]
MAVEIHRVEKEFIFVNLMENDVPVEIHFSGKQILCKITKNEKQRLRLVIIDEAPPALSRGAKINVFFSFREQPMMFRSKVTETGDNSVIIDQPAEIFRDLSREYERIVKPEGVEVSFFYMGKEIKLDFPHSQMFDPVDEPNIEAGFDASRISELLKTIREKAKAIGGESKISMFRERKPELTAEKIIAVTGKILVVPFSFDENPPKDPVLRDRIIRKDEIIQRETQKGTPLFKVLESISKMEDQAGTGRRFIYCPILYHQYTVGYISVWKTGGKPFKTDEIDTFFQLSRVLSYSLKLNGYYQSEPVKEEFDQTELIDISASGLLFSYPTDGPDIHLYTDLEMKVVCDSRTMPITARVMRKFKDAGIKYMGVKYIGMETDDLEFLFDYLYGRKYRGDIDQRGLARLS